MGIAYLLSRIIVLVTGILLYWFLSGKTKYSYFLVDCISSIFMLVSIAGILSFCFGIDGGYYTVTKTDDMSFLSGITLLVCTLSIERNLIWILRKLKNIRSNSCRNRKEVDNKKIMMRGK